MKTQPWGWIAAFLAVLLCLVAASLMGGCADKKLRRSVTTEAIALDNMVRVAACVPACGDPMPDWCGQMLPGDAERDEAMTSLGRSIGRYCLGSNACGETPVCDYLLSNLQRLETTAP